MVQKSQEEPLLSSYVISDNNATWKRGRSYFLSVDPPFSHREHVQEVISPVGRSVGRLFGLALPLTQCRGDQQQEALPRDLSPIIGAPGSVHSEFPETESGGNGRRVASRPPVLYLLLYRWRFALSRNDSFRNKTPGRSNVTLFQCIFTRIYDVSFDYKPSERGREKERDTDGNMMQVGNMSR